MTCETTAPIGRGEHASGEDGNTAGTDDAGPSRSTDSHPTGEPGEPPGARVVALEVSVAPGVSGFERSAYQDLSEKLVNEAARAAGCSDTGVRFPPAYPQDADTPRGGVVRVRLVGDDEMANAHERYCGVAGTTDVITFDLAEGASAHGAALDVDLIVCVDEARRQADKRNHAIETELALYTLHGVLHALGYDDLDEDSYERMHAREDEVFRRLGLGAAFGRGEQE
ncbi:MAG: rRNA maturation RNase YbeY [Phycisphaerales bacterium JB050]